MASILLRSALLARKGRALPPASSRELARLHIDSPYAKELRLLRHVLDFASAGDPASVCLAMDSFNEEVLASSNRWGKTAGGSKAQVLLASLRGAPARRPLLEIGTYCGYSAARMAVAFPEAGITTLEVDPVHVAVARGVLSFAGLERRVHVHTGHCSSLLPRLAAGSACGGEGGALFGGVFMDRWGSQYHVDLASLEECPGLLAPGAVLVADNLLRTGAPLFLWRVAGPDGRFASRLVRVSEFASGPLAQDWMCVSASRRTGAAAARGAAAPSPRSGPPDELLCLHWQSERMREIACSAGRKSTPAEQAAYARDMQQCLAGFGIGAACAVE